MPKRLYLLAPLLFGYAVATAVPASADENSYIADLNAAGVPDALCPEMDKSGVHDLFPDTGWGVTSDCGDSVRLAVQHVGSADCVCCAA